MEIKILQQVSELPEFEHDKPIDIVPTGAVAALAVVIGLAVVFANAVVVINITAAVTAAASVAIAANVAGVANAVTFASEGPDTRPPGGLTS